MAALIPSRRLIQQPQYAAMVDRGNPLTAGLGFLITPGNGCIRDIVNNAFGSLSAANADLSPRSKGISLNFAGTNGKASFPTNTAYNLTSAITMMWFGSVADFGSDNFLIARCEANGITFNPGLLSITASTGYLAFHRANNLYIVAIATSGLTAGTPHVCIATHFGGMETQANWGLWVDGLSKGISFSGVGSGSPWDGKSYPLILGSREDSYAFARSTTYIAAGWNRVLSNAEIASVTANPWQLFRAPTRTIYFTGVGATVYRPSSTIDANGWIDETAAAATYAKIADTTFDSSADSTYIQSPDLATNTTYGISPSIPAGSVDIHTRGMRTAGAAQSRVVLLNGGSVVGTGAWITQDTSFTSNTDTVTTSGIADSFRIEVQ